MSKPAFADDKRTRLELVTESVHQAIMGLEGISYPDQAFVGIIGFGAKAKVMTGANGQRPVASVRQLTTGLVDNLGEYLFDCSERDTPGVNRSHTDIQAALGLARQNYDAAIAGDMSRFDMRQTVKILTHDGITVPGRKEPLKVPNVRIMLYSDGSDNPEQVRPLTNPFESLYPSPLMTAFLGKEELDGDSLEGANQLKKPATIRLGPHRKG